MFFSDMEDLIWMDAALERCHGNLIFLSPEGDTSVTPIYSVTANHTKLPFVPSYPFVTSFRALAASQFS